MNRVRVLTMVLLYVAGESQAGADEKESSDGDRIPAARRAELKSLSHKILFESYTTNNWELFVMNADGTGQTRLTYNSDIDTKPSWSPDGSRIAFYSGRDGNTEIYVMNADGTGQTNLTDNPKHDSHPSWSP